MKKRFFFVLCALLTIATANAADTGSLNPAGETLRWRCWYDQSVHISCLIEEQLAASRSGAKQAAYVPGKNLPPIVRTLRTSPEAFRQQIVSIPLHTPPIDMEFTAQLARACVCGGRPGCSVSFSGKAPPASEIAAILDRRMDETTSREFQLASLDSDDAR